MKYLFALIILIASATAAAESDSFSGSAMLDNCREVAKSTYVLTHGPVSEWNKAMFCMMYIRGAFEMSQMATGYIKQQGHPEIKVLCVPKVTTQLLIQVFVNYASEHPVTRLNISFDFALLEY